MTPEVAPYSPQHIDAVVEIMAGAFVTNPLHLSAFGEGEIDQNRLFFRTALEHMFKSHAYVARLDGDLCGYVHFGEWPGCLPPADHVPEAGETILKPLGDAVPRLVEWFSTWSRLDPQEPHSHLGPIGVSPDAQGKGVGTELMNRYIQHLDENGLAGYLETDRPGNVGFYEKFGFTVKREVNIIGVPTWNMWRPSR